jgi:hypothetical protein
VRDDAVILVATVERGRHGVVHGTGEGVLLVGSREADHLDLVGNRNVDVALGHGTTPLLLPPVALLC